MNKYVTVNNDLEVNSYVNRIYMRNTMTSVLYQRKE